MRHAEDMETNTEPKTRQEAYALWLAAERNNAPTEVKVALLKAHKRLADEESAREFDCYETAYRRDGRRFRVRYDANGNCHDVD